MNFQRITAEELKEHLPKGEDDRWEVKSAKLLEKNSKTALMNELSKQVSAFANSGGGNLVFGVADGTHELEPCNESIGRQPVKDYLAILVEQSVDYPIRGFKVHRIPFESAGELAIFLVVIDDSPAAPHQAKADKKYYYRIDGHSKPAPHFHLELLRSRNTNCIVEAVGCAIVPSIPVVSVDKTFLDCAIVVTVENQSGFLAKPIGVSIEGDLPSQNWAIKGKDSLSPRYVITNEYLFPSLTDNFEFRLLFLGEATSSNLVAELISSIDKITLSIRVFSQNFGSEPIIINLKEYVTEETVRDLVAKHQQATDTLERKMEERLSGICPGLNQEIQKLMGK